MNENKKLSWFRAYAEMVDDEKLRLLSFEDRWHFVALLCCKTSGILDDAGPLMRRKVAVKLGLDVTTLVEVARRLSEVELIDRETLQPRAWERRQHQSDSSAERTKAYRERLKQVKRHSDVTVTPPEEETEAEADTDKKEEREAQLPPPEVRSPHGSRLPTDFPTAEELRWCEQERPDLDAAVVRAKFRDYWCSVPGARGRKLDWPATWRNFVRSERSQQPRASPLRSVAAPNPTRIERTIASLTGLANQPEVIDAAPDFARVVG